MKIANFGGPGSIFFVFGGFGAESENQCFSTSLRVVQKSRKNDPKTGTFRLYEIRERQSSQEPSFWGAPAPGKGVGGRENPSPG